MYIYLHVYITHACIEAHTINACSYFTLFMRASVCSWSSSVSPQNPDMKSEDIVTPNASRQISKGTYTEIETKQFTYTEIETKQWMRSDRNVQHVKMVTDYSIDINTFTYVQQLHQFYFTRDDWLSSLYQIQIGLMCVASPHWLKHHITSTLSRQVKIFAYIGCCSNEM